MFNFFNIQSKNISPQEAKKRLETEKGIILIDVRTPAEYKSGHIPGSISMPLDSLGVDVRKKLPNLNSTIFVYCLSGGRSSRAVSTLERMGYTNVNNLGGISSWPYEIAK